MHAGNRQTAGSGTYTLMSGEAVSLDAHILLPEVVESVFEGVVRRWHNKLNRWSLVLRCLQLGVGLEAARRWWLTGGSVINHEMRVCCWTVCLCTASAGSRRSINIKQRDREQKSHEHTHTQTRQTAGRCRHSSPPRPPGSQLAYRFQMFNHHKENTLAHSARLALAFSRRR